MKLDFLKDINMMTILDVWNQIAFTEQLIYTAPVLYECN